MNTLQTRMFKLVIDHIIKPNIQNFGYTIYEENSNYIILLDMKTEVKYPWMKKEELLSLSYELVLWYLSKFLADPEYYIQTEKENQELEITIELDKKMLAKSLEEIFRVRI